MLHEVKGTISGFGEIKKWASQDGSRSGANMKLTIDVPTGGRGGFYKILFNCDEKTIDKLRHLPIGTPINVKFSLYARDWNGKLYNNVDLVDFAELGGKMAEEAGAPTRTSAPASSAGFSQEDFNADVDDLPFK